MAAVATAAFVAAVFVQFDATPRAAQSPAGAAMMRLLGDEHAAVAGAVVQQVAARTQADALAAREFDNMKLAARDEARSSSRLAQAVTPVRDDKPKATIVRVAAKSEPARATAGAAAAGEPMQLLAMTDTEAMEAPRPPGLVRGTLRQIASPAGRIPSWFSAAAGWVVDAVPVPRVSLPQLPRHFRV